MAVVVGVAPLRRRADHVPLPRIGVDLRVIHPIPLSVGDVVAELHVLDALRHEQSQRADRPSGLAPATPDCQPGGDFEATLKTYDALDIGAVLGAQRRLDVATDLVQRLARALRCPLRSGVRTQLPLRWQCCITSQRSIGVMRRVADARHCGVNSGETGPPIEPRNDTLRPWAAATSSPRTTQCSHNE